MTQLHGLILSSPREFSGFTCLSRTPDTPLAPPHPRTPLLSAAPCADKRGELSSNANPACDQKTDAYTHADPPSPAWLTHSSRQPPAQPRPRSFGVPNAPPPRTRRPGPERKRRPPPHRARAVRRSWGSSQAASPPQDKGRSRPEPRRRGSLPAGNGTHAPPASPSWGPSSLRGAFARHPEGDFCERGRR